VATGPRGQDAVEHIDATRDAFHQIDRLADAHHIAWQMARQVRHRHVDGGAHLVMPLTHSEPAQCDAAKALRDDAFGGLLAKVCEV
tara:strand:+ start:867 stop:1124 length:258 start_codon:yes stop_codon:yes gene_type:complete